MLSDAEIRAQVLAAFQEEQAEHRQAAGELLLELEREPQHPQRQELLDRLFREAHSLKGGARAAGQHEVEQLAHAMEDLFSAVRRGELPLTPEVCDPLYTALDAVGVLMQLVAAGQPVSLKPYAPLLAQLAQIVAGRGAPALPTPDPAPQVAPPNGNGNGHLPPARPSAEPARDEERHGGDALQEVSGTTVRIATSSLDTLLNETGELMTSSLRSQQRVRDTGELIELAGRWRRIWRQARPVYTRLQERAPNARPTAHYLDDHRQTPDETGGRDADHSTGALVEALREANGLIGELERRLAAHGRQIAEDSSRLSTLADRLYTQVRRARMLPLATIFGQLRLQVRETARAAGKRVALELEDGGAEADRQVLERLREVLMHLVRNALDHGIEPAPAREAAGKSPEGCITLQALVSGDRLTLTLRDDGAGLNLEAIRERALGAGLLGAAELARLNDAELEELIFLPGFSTRQTVSALSGRGVGLDIVRSHVERMHGRVHVRSAPGAGCTFTIVVPLSLTSSHGLLLQAGMACYVLPLDAVQRIVPVRAQDIRNIEGRAALLLNERPLPLVQLAELLDDKCAPASRRREVAALALLLGSGERQAACLVDNVIGEQELVMHRLPHPLQQVRFVAGATILADGRVVPLLDAVDLLRAALGAPRSALAATDEAAPARVPTVLVVDDSLTTRTLEKNILESAGYRVRLATDGAEALELLGQMAESGGCDLLLSDVDMPRINGFDLTAQVRADARFQHLPVVLVTSLDTPADRERGIAAGADAYIVKRTFEQQALLETVARLV
jgi:two-component system chemotaxis sensor kinase CheA